MLPLILLLLLFTSTRSDFICERPHGVFPDLSNGSRFYDCVDGVAHHKVCTDGTYFNQHLEICENAQHFELQKMPNKTLGVYILLSHDRNAGYETNSTWTPKLYPWQQKNLNLLFFAFVNPGHMEVPLSFMKLVSSRGSGDEGAVSEDTVILFSIGGSAYSDDPNPWFWLESVEAAEKMAVEVAEWPHKYGCDGIDLDIEKGAGTSIVSGENLSIFIKKLKSLNPDIIVTQPVGGFPHIEAQIYSVNKAWNKDTSSNNLLYGIGGLMVYSGTDSLNYVSNYANATEKWEEYPIKVNVPTPRISVGCKGVSDPDDILKLADEVVQENLMGIMVWYASVIGGRQYSKDWDASESPASIEAYGAAKEILDQYNNMNDREIERNLLIV